MKRDLHQLMHTTYDLVVIGAGIHGACVARDAVSRGLTVALIDRGDFGAATSANSLKTIHGGLRYLQDGNLPLVRRMARERAIWMQVAPHLVHALPCVMPLYRGWKTNRTTMAVALAANNLLSAAANGELDENRRLPEGHVISREECLAILPGLAPEGLTGGAVWHDAQACDSERLTLAVVLSAAGLGATVANYVEAMGLCWSGARVTGVQVRDVLSGATGEVRGRVVVNATGRGIDQTREQLRGRGPERLAQPSLAMNLVVRGTVSDYAAGVPSHRNPGDRKGPVLFLARWRGHTLIGTYHAPAEGRPEELLPREPVVLAFLERANAAYPGAGWRPEDITLVHTGFLPAREGDGTGRVRLIREDRVVDHRGEGVDGLISVVGVKYTTARWAAEQAVDLAFGQLGFAPPPCLTGVVALDGGQVEPIEDFLARAGSRAVVGVSAEGRRRLAARYGSQYERLVRMIEEDSGLGGEMCAAGGMMGVVGEERDAMIGGDGGPVMGVEVVYGVRAEMAQTLADVVFRRTGLGAAGDPGEGCVTACAEVMAAELGWDRARMAREVEQVRAFLAERGALGPASWRRTAMAADSAGELADSGPGGLADGSSGGVADGSRGGAWQLEMFQRSLKKQLKLQALLQMLGDVTGQRCLLVTCGDNNGALNWYFNQHGGRWTWSDLTGENVVEMTGLLGQPVLPVHEAQLPFGEGAFDCVVAIDVLEHLAQDQPFLGEVRRVLRPGGRTVVTVPNGDPALLANQLRWRIGMTPEVYGHTRAGYTIPELEDAARRAGLRPVAAAGYSRFFTEMIELAINFGYTQVLSGRKDDGGAAHIAPASSTELKRHGAAYQLYRLAFPAMRLVSSLDRWLPGQDWYAVAVTALKPLEPERP